MMLGRKLLIGSILLLGGCFLVESVRLPICHFLMRDFNGIYVEVMRKCPAGTSYCAARVSNATGIKSLVIDFYEFYCENEKNITRMMNVAHAPSSGCYRFGPEPDEFVCFCTEDFCNNHDNIEHLFLSIHNSQSFRPAQIQQPRVTTIKPSRQESTNPPFTTLSFNDEFRKLRSPLLTDRHNDWKHQQIRQRRQTQRSFDVKVQTQKFILADEGTIFRKKPTNFK